MRFDGAEPPLTPAEIDRVESELKLRFPMVVRHHYLAHNGGEPNPFVYEDDQIDTVVSACLPLVAASSAARTAPAVYSHLVLAKKLVDPRFFPFAVDGGGDYFFVDCSSADGSVFFFRSDSVDGPHLEPLGIGFNGFWRRLKTE